jgi:glycosyltransferase involved in cell wall biosynthesis
MKPLTVIAQYIPGPLFQTTLSTLAGSGLVKDIIVVCQETPRLEIPGCRFRVTGALPSRETLTSLLDNVGTAYLLILPGFAQVSIEKSGLQKIIEKAQSTKAGLVYCDFYDESYEGRTLHPLTDYQLGSVRDDFNFGAMMLYSVSAIRKAFHEYGPIPSVSHAGLYDIRLKVSIDHSVYHLPEPLYSVVRTEESSDCERIFAYVDPRNTAVQKEMEAVFTDHLRNIGAHVPDNHLREADETFDLFPVEASVIIPVRNRLQTIAEAITNALSQETEFAFNIIVVDNHSTDGTTTVVSDLAGRYSGLHHIIPTRTDLGIGGCWNEALHAQVCGRYAVQLDSDDLYGTPQTLQKIVHMLRQGNYAMVIGSYTIVDFNLNNIPPGLIDHREWSDENGHNNALRVNGLGAPRAFNTSVMRNIGFLDVSYGEDYAAALQISREYRIGRIFESLYLCRRWPGNTDASLSIEEKNKNDTFKDKVRTVEIITRQEINNRRSKTSTRCPETDIPTHPPFLNTRMFAAFEKGQNVEPFSEVCMRLLSEQKETWQGLKQGYESLSETMAREIICSGFSVHILHNPGRIRSTLADIAEKSINKRPCFLCLNNLPENQKGVLYHREFLVLCNPMPVFSGHLTIAHLIHQPQSITEHIDVFLHLMTDFGSRWSMLYNGPKCGASAPDHLHFQAIPSGNLPIEKEIMDEDKRIRIAHIDSVRISRAHGLGRELIILEGDDPAGVADIFKRIGSGLRKVFNTDNEPMMNIIGSHDGGNWRLLVFPRAKHRPDVFFKEGDARITVSPAVIEMGGVMITPVEKDFERIDASIAEEIFNEVSPNGEIVQGVVDVVTGSPHESTAGLS